jgi:hypothetical protein
MYLFLTKKSEKNLDLILLYAKISLSNFILNPLCNLIKISFSHG